MSLIGRYLSLIKFEHTVFALPFALISLLVAPIIVTVKNNSIGLWIGVGVLADAQQQIGQRQQPRLAGRQADDPVDHGAPLGADGAQFDLGAALGALLYGEILKHDPSDPRWIDRDRFVLSAGHGCLLLYTLLHLAGYDVSLDDLKNFRQWGSITPGHPEYGLTPGVEMTTGPLGQGFSTGVGMAIAQAHLAAIFNKPGHELVQSYIYAIVTVGLVNLLVWYGRLHYRLLKPAIEPQG